MDGGGGVEVEGDGALTADEGRLLDFGAESSTSTGEAGTDCDLTLTNFIIFMLLSFHGYLILFLLLGPL